MRLAAVAVGDEMKTDDDDDVGRYAKAPRRDPAVTFESDGTAAVGGVKMSVASVASPADEQFGTVLTSLDPGCVLLLVVCGALVCFVNVTFAAWVAAYGCQSSALENSAPCALNAASIISGTFSWRPTAVSGVSANRRHLLTGHAGRARRGSWYLTSATRSAVGDRAAMGLFAAYIFSSFSGELDGACVSDASTARSFEARYRSPWIGNRGGWSTRRGAGARRWESSLRRLSG